MNRIYKLVAVLWHCFKARALPTQFLYYLLALCNFLVNANSSIAAEDIESISLTSVVSPCALAISRASMRISEPYIDHFRDVFWRSPSAAGDKSW